MTAADWSRITESIGEILHSLISHSDILSRTLTAPIVAPVLSQMSKFHARLLEYSAQSNVHHLPDSDDQYDNQVIDATVSCIDLCLISVQNLQKISDRGEMSLIDAITHTIQIFQAFHIKKHIRSISNLAELLKGAQGKLPAYVARLSLPFVRSLARAHSILTSDLCEAHKSIGKLVYVCLRVFRTLLAKGFCSGDVDESEGDGDGSNMTFEDNVEGTGMGEGDGMKDVSDQIRDEDQIGGLKGDKPEEAHNKPENPLSEEDKERGIEMQQDFIGDMHDVPGMLQSWNVL